MIDFVGKKNWFFVASAIPIIVGIIFIIINGMPWGLDFKSGTEMTVESLGPDTLQTKLSDIGHPEATIQDTGGTQLTIKTNALGEEDQGNIQKLLEGMGLTVASIEPVSDGSVVTVALDKRESITTGALRTKLADLGHSEAAIQKGGKGTFYIDTKELTAEDQSKIKNAFGEAGWIVSGLSSISDPIAHERARNSIIGIVIASVAMLLYIWWAFRKVSNPIHYGTCAVLSLLYAVFICVAFYVIFADSLNLQIDLMFITGILTVIGYSINDTVVVFDRIRENLGRGGHNLKFEDVVNASLTETITRCIITVLTVILAAVAVWLFVGDPIRNLLMVLLVGIASGTYSSIFNASMLLVVWENRKTRQLKGKALLAQKAK
jgi:preprotein translocase subunit SecF